MIYRFFKPKKRDVVQYIIVLAVVAIILAFAFPKIRDKMGIATKSTVSNIDVGLGNMFSNSQPSGNPPAQCLPSVDYEVPQSMRQTLKSSYTYEYAIDANLKIDITDPNSYKKARTYVYSNTPLSLSIRTHSSSYYPYYYIYEATGKSYAGIDLWNWTYSDDYNVEVNYILSPPTTFTNGTLKHVQDDFSTSLIDSSSITGITDMTQLPQGC